MDTIYTFYDENGNDEHITACPTCCQLDAQDQANWDENIDSDLLAPHIRAVHLSTAH